MYSTILSCKVLYYWVSMMESWLKIEDVHVNTNPK